MRSRHQKEVATGAKQLTEPFCRDVASELETVATSAAKERRSRHQLNGRDIRCTEQQVATRSSCRDINYTERKSRHHSEVATTLVIEEGRDNTWLSRHQLQRKEVAIRSSCRDIMKQSRQQEQETKVATTPGGRDNSCKDQRVAKRSIGRDIKIQGIKRRRQ